MEIENVVTYTKGDEWRILMKKKRILAIMLTIIILTLSIGMNTFAAERSIQKYTVYQTNNYYNVLNCYTSGSVVSGTLVSTWSYTGNDSQRWNVDPLTTGGYIWYPVANPAVSINANRSYVGTQVNVLTTATNVVQDYTLIFNANEDIPITLLMHPRGGHINNVVITSHGSNSICTWQYVDTSLNQLWSPEYGYIPPNR